LFFFSPPFCILFPPLYASASSANARFHQSCNPWLEWFWCVLVSLLLVLFCLELVRTSYSLFWRPKIPVPAWWKPWPVCTKPSFPRDGYLHCSPPHHFESIESAVRLFLMALSAYLDLAASPSRFFDLDPSSFFFPPLPPPTSSLANGPMKALGGPRILGCFIETLLQFFQLFCSLSTFCPSFPGFV